MDSKNDKPNEIDINRLLLLQQQYEHLEKLYKLKMFLNQIRYPDQTAAYLNQFDII